MTTRNLIPRPPQSPRRVLLILLALALSTLLACQPEDLGFGVSDLPAGDAQHGAQVFGESINGAPACSACHAIGVGAKSAPSLDEFGAVAAERVSDQDAATYAFTSIVRPAKHVVRGYSNVMYSDYAKKLSRQDIADLIAYLTTLGAD